MCSEASSLVSGVVLANVIDRLYSHVRSQKLSRLGSCDHVDSCEP